MCAVFLTDQYSAVCRQWLDTVDKGSTGLGRVGGSVDGIEGTTTTTTTITTTTITATTITATAPVRHSVVVVQLRILSRVAPALTARALLHLQIGATCQILLI